MRWILPVVAAGCAAGAGMPAPALAPLPASPGLTVTLVWAAPVDLDLYVTDPGWATVYYARGAGRFGRDVRCDAAVGEARAERADWPAPRPGRYRVGVDFPDACDTSIRVVPYRVVVDRSGTRQEFTGTARLEERQPAAAEFVVP